MVVLKLLCFCGVLSRKHDKLEKPFTSSFEKINTLISGVMEVYENLGEHYVLSGGGFERKLKVLKQRETSWF